jgi:[ribosomal protein S18]-alanine N-acetyltransferase
MSIENDTIHFLADERLWQILSTLGSLVALAFIFKQMRDTRNIAAYNFLSSARKEFFSKQFCEHRRDLALALLKKKGHQAIYHAAEPLLLHFEELGTIYKKRISSRYLIWTIFGDEIDFYWQVLKDTIDWCREDCDDTALYIEFEHLHKQMTTLEKRYNGKYAPRTDEEVFSFLRSELKVKIKLTVPDNIRGLTIIEMLSFNKHDELKEEEFRELLQTYPYGTYCLYSLDEMIGYFLIYLTEDRKIYVESIAIHPNYRGLQLSHEILDFIVSFAEQNNAPTIELDVRVENPAINLYKRFGFEEVGRVDSFYSDGAPSIRMQFHIHSDG